MGDRPVGTRLRTWARAMKAKKKGDAARAGAAEEAQAEGRDGGGGRRPLKAWGMAATGLLMSMVMRILVAVTYLIEPIDLVFVLGRVVLLRLQGAQEHIDLGDGDLGHGVVPSGAAGTRAGTRTQHTCLRRMWRVGDSCL